MKTKFYAVKAGRNPGIYLSWDEAKAQVNGFAGAEYKSFTSKSEALDFINGDKSFNYPLQSANFSDKVDETKSTVASTNPNCRCNRAAKKQLVKKQNANFGREFYSCSLKQCNFFMFADGKPSNVSVTDNQTVEDNIRIHNDTLVIYTDGACQDNGMSEKFPLAGWGVVILEHGDGASDEHARIVEEIFGPVVTDYNSPSYMGAQRGTNNTAELSAIGEALKYLIMKYTNINTDYRNVMNGIDDISRLSSYVIPPTVIRYDSEYAALSVSGEYNGPKNSEIINYIRRLYRYVQQNLRIDGSLKFSKVKAHSFHRWNDRADELARLGARGDASNRVKVVMKQMPSNRAEPMNPKGTDTARGILENADWQSKDLMSISSLGNDDEHIVAHNRQLSRLNCSDDRPLTEIEERLVPQHYGIDKIYSVKGIDVPPRQSPQFPLSAVAHTSNVVGRTTTSLTETSPKARISHSSTRPDSDLAHRPTFDESHCHPDDLRTRDAYNGTTNLNSSVPDGWERLFTSDGRMFYANHHSQTTHWTIPHMNLHPASSNANNFESNKRKHSQHIPASLETRGGHSQVLYSSDSVLAAKLKTAADSLVMDVSEDELRSGDCLREQFLLRDSQPQKTHVNLETFPAHSISATSSVSDSGSSPYKKKQSLETALPEGWEEIVDNGCKYYVHRMTGVKLRNRPPA